MGIKMGFAGTVAGMTDAQRTAFAEYVSALDVTEFRVGGLTGADEQATEIVCRTTPTTVIVCRPVTGRSDVRRGESVKVLAVANTVMTAATRADARRSVGVVDPSDLIVLAPRSRNDGWGGTVATYRYAHWRRKPITFIWPDGTVETRAAR